MHNIISLSHNYSRDKQLYFFKKVPNILQVLGKDWSTFKVICPNSNMCTVAGSSLFNVQQRLASILQLTVYDEQQKQVSKYNIIQLPVGQLPLNQDCRRAVDS